MNIKSLFSGVLLFVGMSVGYSQTSSNQDGDWNDPSTWNPAVVPDFNSGVITISHTVTIPNGQSITADQISVTGTGILTIALGGTLTLNNGTGNDLTLVSGSDLNVSGTLICNNLSVISGSTAATTTFFNGGRYRHLYTTVTGTLPLATWQSNSILELAGYTTASGASALGNWSQNFGNVEWNCPSQSFTFNLNGLMTSIAGNFSILSTGTGILRFATTQNPTISIGNDLVISGTSYVQMITAGTSPGGIINVGNNFTYTSTNANGCFVTGAGICTVNITNNFAMNAPGGNIRMASGATGTGRGLFNIGGDFTLTAGTITEFEAEPGEGVITFVGSNKLHAFENTGTLSNRLGFVVPASNTVQFNNESSMGGGVTSYLDLSGSLILSSTNANGAIQTTAAGNVRTAVKTYNPGSTLIYGGGSAQVIGNGQPNNTNVTTIINNNSGVSLNNTSSTSLTIKKLQLVAGTLTVANDDLVVDETLAIDGGSLILSSASAVRSMTSSGTLTRTAGTLQVSSGVNAATFIMNGTIGSGSDFVTFSGSNSNLSIGGSGSLGASFPFSGTTSLHTLTLSRSSATISLNDIVTAVNVTISSGDIDVDANMTVTGNLNMASGTGLSFQDQTLELRGLLNNSLSGGLLSSNSNSILNITGSGTLGALAFNGSANTLGSLTLNRPTGGNLVTLNSTVLVSNSLTLTDGDFLNTSGLTLSSGATINRNSNAALTGSAPLGGPYNVSYSGSSMTAGQELQGTTGTITCAISGNLNSILAVAVPGTLVLTSGTWVNSGGLAMGASSLISRNSTSGPMTGSIPTGGPYSLTYTGASLSTGVEARGALSTLTINVSGIATINTAVAVSGTLNLVQGSLTNNNTLTMANNSTISRNSVTTFTGNTPQAGPYNLIYSGGSLSTSTEASGNLASMTINTSGLVTLTASSNLAGTLQINSGAFTAGSNTLSVQSIVNSGTFTASSSMTTISGDIQNNSTFNSNAGTFNFTGNSSLSGSTPIVFNNITITGALTSSALFRLTGNFINNGSFVNNSGTIEFIGVGTQLAGGTVPTTFFNINSTAPMLSIASNQNLMGVLTLGSGSVLDADGASNTSVFTLLSTSDAPSTGGSIGPLLNGASVSGSLTGQRFISAEGVIRRYISSFITNGTVAQWQDDFLITGSFDESDYPCGGLCGTNGSSLTYYNEAVLGSSDLGYVGIPSTTNTENLLPGVGYRAYMWSGASQMNLDLTGTINQGSIALPVSYTPSVPPNASNDGWNLVGNPYPSAIRWDNTSNWTKSNVSATVYVTDNSAGTVYRYYNANTSVGDLTNGVIAMGQSFWVRTIASSPSLTIHESAKVNSSGNFYREATHASDHLMITLSNDQGYTDNCFLVIDERASNLYEEDFDAVKWKNDKLNISSVLETSEMLAINTLMEFNNLYVPLAIEVDKPGDYVITISDRMFLRHGDGHYYLYDAENDLYSSLANGASVSVHLKDVKTKERFYVVSGTERSISSKDSGITLSPNPTRTKFTIQKPTGEMTIKSLTLMALNGPQCKTYDLNSPNAILNMNDWTFDVSDMEAGVYLIRILAEEGVFFGRLIKL